MLMDALMLDNIFHAVVVQFGVRKCKIGVFLTPL